MSETVNELEKIDVTAIIDSFVHSLKKLWIVVLILPLALGAFSYFRTQGTYVPAYKAEATVAVYASDDTTTTNSRSAQQLGTVFPYILTSGVLKDVIKEDMDVKALPGNIKVTNVEGTNLLTISVSSSDPDLSYKTLLSIIKNYPRVAEYVVGFTTMKIVDDSGIPTDSGKTVAVRGNALKGALYGFVIGLIVVFVHMLTYKTVRTVKDVRAFSTFDHLGTLPIYKKKKRKETVSSINILEHNVQQDYLEAMRLVRTRLTRKLEESGHKTIMVTSSVPGEGKSTIAANLAISLAGKSKRVILVDCDLRNPSLQDIFKRFDEKNGLMDVLEGKALLRDALVSFESTGIQLKVLFGSLDSITSHSEILGSNTMGELIDMLKKLADVVILDTPPSAMLVDASLLAKYVDEAIYVIMSDYARASVVAEGLRELKNTGIEIGGFVLNGSKESSGGYGYHSYGYGSHYYGYQSEDTEKDKQEEAKDETSSVVENNSIPIIRPEEKTAEKLSVENKQAQQEKPEEPKTDSEVKQDVQKPASQQMEQENTEPITKDEAKKEVLIERAKPLENKSVVEKPVQNKKPAYVGRHRKDIGSKNPSEQRK